MNGGYCCNPHGTPTGYLLSDDEKHVRAHLSSYIIPHHRAQYIQGHVLSLGKMSFINKTQFHNFSCLHLEIFLK